MSYQMFLTLINLVRGFFLFYLGGALHKTLGPLCNLPFRLFVIFFFLCRLYHQLRRDLDQ